jgi:hypothetical protein
MAFMDQLILSIRLMYGLPTGSTNFHLSQNEAIQWLRSHTAEAWACFPELLATSSEFHVRFFAANGLYANVRQHWLSLSPQMRSSINDSHWRALECSVSLSGGKAAGSGEVDESAITNYEVLELKVRSRIVLAIAASAILSVSEGGIDNLLQRVASIAQSSLEPPSSSTSSIDLQRQELQRARLLSSCLSLLSECVLLIKDLGVPRKARESCKTTFESFAPVSIDLCIALLTLQGGRSPFSITDPSLSPDGTSIKPTISGEKQELSERISRWSGAASALQTAALWLPCLPISAGRGKASLLASRFGALFETSLLAISTMKLMVDSNTGKAYTDLHMVQLSGRVASAGADVLARCFGELGMGGHPISILRGALGGTRSISGSGGGGGGSNHKVFTEEQLLAPVVDPMREIAVVKTISKALVSSRSSLQTALSLGHASRAAALVSVISTLTTRSHSQDWIVQVGKGATTVATGTEQQQFPYANLYCNQRSADVNHLGQGGGGGGGGDIVPITNQPVGVGVLLGDILLLGATSLLIDVARTSLSASLSLNSIPMDERHSFFGRFYFTQLALIASTHCVPNLHYESTGRADAVIESDFRESCVKETLLECSGVMEFSIFLTLVMNTLLAPTRSIPLPLLQQQPPLASLDAVVRLHPDIRLAGFVNCLRLTGEEVSEFLRFSFDFTCCDDSTKISSIGVLVASILTTTLRPAREIHPSLSLATCRWLCSRSIKNWLARMPRQSQLVSAHTLEPFLSFAPTALYPNSRIDPQTSFAIVSTSEVVSRCFRFLLSVCENSLFAMRSQTSSTSGYSNTRASSSRDAARLIGSGKSSVVRDSSGGRIASLTLSSPQRDVGVHIMSTPEAAHANDTGTVASIDEDDEDDDDLDNNEDDDDIDQNVEDIDDDSGPLMAFLAASTAICEQSPALSQHLSPSEVIPVLADVISASAATKAPILHARSHLIRAAVSISLSSATLGGPTDNGGLPSVDHRPSSPFVDPTSPIYSSSSLMLVSNLLRRSLSSSVSASVEAVQSIIVTKNRTSPTKIDENSAVSVLSCNLALLIEALRLAEVVSGADVDDTDDSRGDTRHTSSYTPPTFPSTSSSLSSSSSSPLALSSSFTPPRLVDAINFVAESLLKPELLDISNGALSLIHSRRSAVVVICSFVTTCFCIFPNMATLNALSTSLNTAVALYQAHLYPSALSLLEEAARATQKKRSLELDPHSSSASSDGSTSILSLQIDQAFSRALSTLTETTLTAAYSKRLSSEEESVEGMFSLLLTCLRSMPLSVINKDVLIPAIRLSSEAVIACPQANVTRSVVTFFENLLLQTPPSLLHQVNDLLVLCSNEVGTAIAEMIFENGVNISSSSSSSSSSSQLSSIIQNSRSFSRGSEGSELLCALLRTPYQSESLCSGVLNAVELIANRSLLALSLQYPSGQQILQNAHVNGDSPLLSLKGYAQNSSFNLPNECTDLDETGILSLSRLERRNVVFKAFELITGSSRATSAMVSNINAGGSPQGRMGPSPRQGTQLLADVTKLCRGLLQRGALSDWNVLTR